MKMSNKTGQKKPSVRGKTKLQQARDHLPRAWEWEAIIPWDLKNRKFDFSTINPDTFQQANATDFENVDKRLRACPDYQISANPTMSIVLVTIALAILLITISIILLSFVEIVGYVLLFLTLYLLGGAVWAMWMGWKKKLERRYKQLANALREFNEGEFKAKQIELSLGRCGAWILAQNLTRPGKYMIPEQLL